MINLSRKDELYHALPSFLFSFLVILWKLCPRILCFSSMATVRWSRTSFSLVAWRRIRRPRGPMPLAPCNWRNWLPWLRWLYSHHLSVVLARRSPTFSHFHNYIIYHIIYIYYMICIYIYIYKSVWNDMTRNPWHLISQHHNAVLHCLKVRSTPVAFTGTYSEAERDELRTRCLATRITRRRLVRDTASFSSDFRVFADRKGGGHDTLWYTMAMKINHFYYPLCKF